MGRSIKENGLKERITLEMVVEFKYGLMALDMMDFGKMEWLMVKAGLFTLMETYILENGRKTRLMDLVYNKIIMVVGTKGTGSMINNMVKEQKHGLMDLHIMVNI